MPLSPNTRLGRYEIRLLLGAGGMGEVYLAQDTKLGRTVALKILPAAVASDLAYMRRFIQEAKTASALNHPNIITIYEVEQIDSTHFIATEFVNGETLQKYMEHARIMFPDVLDICMQTASALAAAHEAGIIHRDIKPDNIMIRRDGIVKVLDFGLAKLAQPPLKATDTKAETKPQFRTEPGTVMGTVQYMSPEQARGLEVDVRTDIWSLGVVLYEMVAGRQPFIGRTTADIVVAILTSSAQPVANFVQDASPGLQRIIARALEKDRAKRYQNAGELLDDLRAVKKRLEFILERPAAFGATLAATAQDSITQVFGASELRATKETAPRRAATAANDSTAGLPPNNLAAQRRSMVGRETEIEEICREVRRDGVRLLTLTGVGGTGKTTLAHAVAQRLLPEFPDGVFFIELAAIKQPELVASTIARPLGVKEAEGKSILELLKEYLRERELLLVVDNFEQVLAAGPVVAELLAAASQIKMLVTSRGRLHLSVEREYLVPPLAVPETLARVSTDEFRRYEAVRLFIERARGVKASFNLTDENAQSVAEICARLDGLPLAIELAAARVKVLSPQAILSRLHNRLQLLTGGARDLPTRQQTMRGAVDWSYELLPESEKQLFRRLAVFAGGFTFEASETVVFGQLSPDAKEIIQESTAAVVEETGDLLEGITSLVDKNLLVAKEQPDGESRFRMLEIVREYALERLEASGETEAMRRKHAAYFLAFAEAAEPRLQGAQPAKWLKLLEQEHGNLRAALRWSLKSDAATAGRLAAAIRYFWDFQGYLTEGFKISQQILKLGHSVPTSARWKLLSMAGNMAKFQGDYETARIMYEQGLFEGRAANDLPQISLSCRGLGGLALSHGDYTLARTFMEEALRVARESNDQFGIARSLNMLGDLARSLGDDAAARPLHEEALEICRRLDNKFAVANILNNLAAAEYSDGDYPAASSHFAEGLNLAKESGDKIAGDKIAISYSLDGFAALAVQRGEAELAAKLAGAAEYLRETINFNISEPAERRFRDACLGYLHALLSENAFSKAYDEGRKLKLEEAITLALGDA